MKTFYTGTTLECLHQILEDGCIRVSPPKRVWETFSQNYVYLVPSVVLNERGEEEECSDTLKEFALEQATFALGKLKSSMRVVLEIENIDESKLEPDDDGKGIHAVRFPEDIPVSKIREISFVQGEHRDMYDVRRLAALYWFDRSNWNSTMVENIAGESGYYEEEEGCEERVFNQIDVPFIETLQIPMLIDPHERFVLLDELYERYIYGVEWVSHSIEDYRKTNM